MRVFTLGRADRRIEAILGELTFHGVTHVLDVRPTHDRITSCSDTSSKMMQAGIRYADLGSLFGYSSDMSLNEVNELKDSDRHDANVQILLEMANNDDRRLCLFGEPHEAHRCHRGFLLGESLHLNGLVVTHIENGMALTHAFVMDRLTVGV